MTSQGDGRPTPVALITGGSTGIGAACVRKFLTAGWNISVLALPDAELSWLEPLDVLTIAGDITSEETREMAVQQTLAAYGRIDLLINNAGVGLYGLPTEVSPALFSRLLEVNVVAPLALAQLVVPVMLDQRFGTIVTMGSVAGNVPLPWAAAYSASKAALHSIHDALRLEIRGTPVHLIKVCPGIVDTDFRDNVLEGQPPERVRGIRHVISPDDLAAAIYRSVQRRSKVLHLPAAASIFSALGRFAPLLMDLYLSRFLPPPERSARPVRTKAREQIHGEE